MYERAVLRKPVGKTFGATVDLWSIGNDFVFLFRASFFLRLYSNKISITVFYFRCYVVPCCNRKFTISTIWWKAK